MPTKIQATEKIRSFQKLNNGWHYDSGEPIGYDVREKAISLIKFASEHKISRFDAFPGAFGDITVALYIDDWSLSIHIEEGLIFHFVEDHNNEILREEYETEEMSIRQKIWEFSQPLQVSSALSTWDTGKQREDALIHSLLIDRLLSMEAAYRQSQSVAWSQKEPTYATTSGNGILPTS